MDSGDKKTGQNFHDKQLPKRVVATFFDFRFLLLLLSLTYITSDW